VTVNGAATRIRALVVEDEPLARDRVVALLEAEPDVEVVGACADGKAAIAAIRQLDPDVVFLDIQIPGPDGFEVIRTVTPDAMPVVVFITAYDQYALRAFEVRALDYLLKPFDRQRFSETVQRVRRHVEERHSGELGKRLLALVQDLKPASSPRLDRIVVKDGGRVFFLRADEIDCIEAAGNYVKLHRAGQSHLIRETMSALEARLDSQVFYRIHRSAMVNIERIQELQPWFTGEYRVILRDGTKLPLSRGYRERLQERLGKTF